MPTKVFISWSGDLSQKVAETIRQWLPGVLQFVKPYFTPSDVEKGARWATDVLAELSSSQLGIICLTKDNLDKPWILFESGALAKSFEKSKVCTLLLDVEPADLTGPLTIFQATRFDQADFKKLVKSVNATGGDAKLDDVVLDEVFGMWWPKLEKQISSILGDSKATPKVVRRPERDILEEILELTRLSTRTRTGEPPLPRELVAHLVDYTMRLVDATRRGDHRRILRHMDDVQAVIGTMCRAMDAPDLYERIVMMRGGLLYRDSGEVTRGDEAGETKTST